MAKHEVDAYLAALEEPKRGTLEQLWEDAYVRHRQAAPQGVVKKLVTTPLRGLEFS